jgi:hypothetical protein
MIRLARPIFVLLALGLLMLVGTTRAQEAAKDKKPLTPSQALLENWNDIGGRLVTMAEDWPEDKYMYKLAPTMRTFQEVILHVAGSNYDLLKNVTGAKVGDGRNDPPPAEYKTKAETVAFLKKSVADGAAEIKKEGDAGVPQHLDYWIGYDEHMGEHYGLLVAYYRASGLVPPESRPKK